MNRIYQSIWNAITQTFVATPESARSKGKSGSSVCAASPNVMGVPAFSGFRSMVLEQRFVFDGAAVADFASMSEVTGVNAPLISFALADKSAVAPNLLAAQATAERLVTDFISRGDAKEQLFALFNGGSSGAPSVQWSTAFDQFIKNMDSMDSPVRVELRSAQDMGGAKGAFALVGVDETPTIFVNADWLSGNPATGTAAADAASITKVLVEEWGHYMDSTLNPESDTPGDEGEMFSRVVVDGVDTQTLSYLSQQDDHGTLSIDGQDVQAEFANFNFSNAYEMVYDLNNNGAIDNTERWADKEQNLHYFNSNNSLGAVQVLDGTNNQNFSGNDVSATSIVIGGTTYHGWISRPIKANGDVKGFYFWTDVGGSFGGKAAFTSLTIAQADGNMDGDSNSSDNRGFLLVVDQSWFDSQIQTNRTQFNINNSKDGALGNVYVANVGSSSDRVDSAINSLIVPNSGPTSANDIGTVIEDQTLTVSAANGLLANDTDPNHDPLTVTSFSVNGVSGTVGSALPVTGGSITVNADGSYSFVPTQGYTGPIPVVSYTISDGHGGIATASLSLVVTPVNDAPSGTDKTITTREGIAYTFGAGDFGFADPDDSPANTLSSVTITTLPGAGSLTLNGVAVTAGQEISLADLSKLKYISAANANGAGYASFTFQVRDNGGTANGGVDLDASPNTITFNVTNVNSAPVALADTSSSSGAVAAVESGYGVAGSNATGNVLSNDTDPDSGDSQTVVGATGTGATSGTGPFTVVGRYGTLTIDADGSYNYVVDDTNPAVQALRLTSNTLTDHFGYTMEDGGGLRSSSTLAVTITGTNDAPVANPDFNRFTISTTSNVTLTGNVLNNDTDVDTNGETKSLVGLEATGTYVSYAAGGSSTSLAFAATNNSFFNGVAVGDFVYFQTSASPARYYHLLTSGDAKITVTSKATNEDGTFAIGLSGTIAKYGTTAITLSTQTLVFATNDVADNSNITGTSKEASITSSTTITKSTVTLSGTSGEIAAGMTVSGTNIPPGSKVLDVTSSGGNLIVTLDQSVTSAPSGTITFTALAGSTVTGKYGSLQINADGSYTYTADVNASGGVSGADVFSYKMQDAGGVTSASTLTIYAQSSASGAVVASTDAATVTEDTTLSRNAATGLLANDTASSGTKSITAFTWGGSSGTLGTPMTISGVGTLTINSDGSYSFAPAANYTGAIPVVGYTMTNGTTSASSTLTLTMSGVNDAPVGVADTAQAYEAGGYANGLAGINPSGNVLTNDSDPDGNTLTVSAISGGTVGQAKAGSYGSITLNSDGSYTYTVNNSNSSVQALAVGSTPLTDTFTYTVSDGSLTSTATLTVSIRGANDAPVNTLPGTSPSIAEGATGSISGLSMADVDDTSNMTITLSVSNGTISVSNLSGTAVSAGSNGTATLTLSGSKADLNTALGFLTYTGAAGFSGTDTLSMETMDAGGLLDLDTLDINVTADNRALTVSGTTVNEASPYVFFTVGGATGQQVTLAINSGTATLAADFSPNLEYFDGTSWQPYGGGPLTMLGATLLVRTAVYNDAAFEGLESLTLTANNKFGTSTIGNSYIKDDGTGDVFLASNTSGNPDTSGTGFPASLDDDRPVTVNNVSVNEASPYAVFTVTGASGQVIQLALGSQTASVGTDTGNTPSGTELEYFDGSAWVGYTPSSNITMTSATLLVRTAITNDGTFEGQEAFYLAVTKASNSNVSYGIGSIYDDGTGQIFLESNTSGNADISGTGYPAALDDDRSLNIDSPVVNEASNYTVFTLGGNSGQTVSLALVNESSNGTVTGKANVNALQTLKVWDGQTWVDYSAGNLPTFDAFGKVYVRVDIIAEQDSPYEGAESYTLNATLSGRAGAVTGVATIMDDGTGVKQDGTFSGSGNTLSVNTNTTGLDDDRTISVGDVTVVEGTDNYVTFSVTGVAGQQVALVLVSTGSSSLGVAGTNDVTDVIEINDGSGWVTYTGSLALPSSGVLQARVALRNDATVESTESFKLRATNLGGATFDGTATILDDDGSATFSVNDVSVNEAAGTATFTATRSGNTFSSVNVDYATSGGTAISGTDFTAVSGSLNFGPGENSKTFTVAITNDVVFEGSEVFTVTLSNPSAGATLTRATGTGTILDDGSGAGGSDDDRPTVTVSSVTVSEASPYAVFEISLSNPSSSTISFTPTLNSGSATVGSDTGNSGALQYFDGNHWVGASGGITLAANTTSVLVRTAITQDSDYEVSENFTLTTGLISGGVANTSGATGTGTIKDDGTSTNIFDENNRSPIPTVGPADNDNLNPQAAADSASYTPGSAKTIFILDNDTGGDAVVPSSVVFVSANATDGGKTLVVAGQGVWVVQTNGSITFTPEAGFSGDPSPITYSVSNAQGNTSTATVTLKAEPLPPAGSQPPAPVPLPTPIPVAPAIITEPPAPQVASFDSATQLIERTPLAAVAFREFSDTLTSSSGFRVAVESALESASEPRLSVFNGVANQFALSGRTTSFSLPFDAFSHTRSDAVVSLKAMQLDGSPLPPWIAFDAQAGKFEVDAPNNFTGELKIIIIATDGAREARAQFTFIIGDAQSQVKPFVKGRPGLTEQMLKMGRAESSFHLATGKPVWSDGKNATRIERSAAETVEARRI